jgi:hypothetical protein
LRKVIDILYKRPFFALTLFLVVAYFPVFLPMFHLKNDLISQNLPTRFVISESLYSGYFPWWNPYINFGIPQYGDMNNGFWNPFMWLIAKTVGYNIWTITYEEMFYILIGGWGIYKVVRELGIEKGIAIVSSLSYMSCGYIVGHLQHFCWVTGTGFFPYVLLFFLRINKSPVVKNYILGGITVFLFVSSAHPGLVIGSAYFFLFPLVGIFVFRRNATRTFHHPKFLLINLGFLFLALLFSIGVIISDLDVLLHISRGNKPPLSESLLEPTTLQCYLSLLFPLAVNKSSLFETDVSMRNVFMGIGSFCGVILLLQYLNKKILVALGLAILFFVFLAAGGLFKTVAYYALPLVGNVRLNGEFAYFALVIAILAGAFGLQELLADDRLKRSLKRLLGIFIILSLLAAISAVLIILVLPGSTMHVYSNRMDDDFKSTVRALIDHLTAADLLLISALILLASLLVIRINLWSTRKIVVIVVLNLVINTWLTLPFTGLGMKSKKQINNEMTQFGPGISRQELQPLYKTKFIDSGLKGQFTMLGSYSKKIGYPDEEQYPVELKNTQNFFSDSSLFRFITHQSYVFLSTDTTVTAETNFDSTTIKIKKFAPGNFHVFVNNGQYRFITFLQNDYPYWQTLVNGRMVRHYTSFKSFISVPIEPGNNDVEFFFNPTPIKKGIMINGAIILLALACLMFRGLRDYPLVRDHSHL